MISNFLLAAAIALPTALAGPLSARSANIIGGTDAQAGDFPSIVAITYDDGSQYVNCGGNLLNENTIVTAAHCSGAGDISLFRVRAGSLDFSTGGQLVNVSEIILHPQYNSATNENDVAIWKLSTAIKPADNLSYALLPSAGSDPSAGSEVTIAGWGFTILIGNPATQLQKTTSIIVDREVCNADYASEGLEITDTMICAEHKETGRHDHCNGDSGGPVLNADGVLVGIISWAKSCALPKYPGVSVNVASVLDFINENL